MNKLLLHFIIILSIIGLILPVFSFAQIKTPETPEEVKDFLLKIIRPLPDAIKRAWQEALAIWQKMADFLTNLWDVKIKPWFQSLWQQILAIFRIELEKKELMIKEEIKKEIPKAGKNIWERLKGLIGR